MSQADIAENVIPYKYLDLRIYSSTEWLAGNRKKYRQVYEQSEISYIYVELSIINKYYDHQPWEALITLKCLKVGEGKKEVCSLDISRQISKHDHTLYIREGWGHKNLGSFWKPGKYRWEAYIAGKKIATKYFFVENIGKFLKDQPSKALSPIGVEFYEGNFDDAEEQERIFYTQFSDKDTRYVFVDLTFENRLSQLEWYAEIFIKFYNSARELKGEVIRLQKIKRGDKEVTLNAGWGSNIKGSWRQGKYTVEVVFQDEMIAQSAFEIGDFFEEGNSQFDYPAPANRPKVAKTKVLSAPEAFRELNALVGLRSIKRQISDHTKYIRFLKLRSERGFNEKEQLSLHSVFTGNPGTGKTTIARMLGTIYHSIGLLAKGHVHEVDRVDLIGEYIGQTAPKVKDAIKKASGGVLFIDEAYALTRSHEDSKDFGREVIELLVKEMGDPSCDFMVVVAGYPKEMKTFIDSNPGLNSRFKYYYDFDDYTLSELQDILEVFCERYEVLLTPHARSKMHDLIQEGYRKRDKSFGNARFVGRLLEKAKINMGIRLIGDKEKTELSDQDLRQIRLQDVLKIEGKSPKSGEDMALNQNLLDQALEELDDLVGLETIKAKIHELVHLVKFRQDRDVSTTGQLNLHTVLIGNPGTGKTTIARIMAKIYKALGILERGHLIETDRQGLVAGYVGQTAIKTAEVIERAKGGVLFIDEAYALNKSGTHNDFGDEAIQVMLKKMEDLRGQLFIFVAGYPNQMEAFLNANPGLNSRFDHHWYFEDYTSEELVHIAQSFIRQKGYKISSDAIKELSVHLEREHKARDVNFGNARRVRQYVNEIVKQQNLRLAKEESQSHGPNYAQLIKQKDVEVACLSLNREGFGRRSKIGF